MADRAKPHYKTTIVLWTRTKVSIGDGDDYRNVLGRALVDECSGSMSCVRVTQPTADPDWHGYGGCLSEYPKAECIHDLPKRSGRQKSADRSSSLKPQRSKATAR